MVSLREEGTVLVTGASGFVGTVLCRLLVERGFDVLGVASTSVQDSASDDRIRRLEQDLTLEPLATVEVDAVVHLAGLAQVGPSFDEPQRYISQNSAMMTNVCEPLLAAGSVARVVIVSSGAVYGAGSGKPLDESAPTSFTSPYAVSKVLVENQALYYRERGLDMVIARPFNHIGPGQREGFIVPDLVAKLKALSAGDRLIAGNLDARRDYTDVRDVAEAYVSLLIEEALTHTHYNVASGASRSGWDMLTSIAAALDLSVPEATAAKVRALDPSDIVGDARRLREETGWRPRISLDQSIADYVASV